MKLNDADNIYLGGVNADAVYAAGVKVWPSFPIVKSVATTSSPAGTTHNVNMPTGVRAGDLLLSLVGVGGVSSLGGSAWTTMDSLSAQYRIATGGGSDTLIYNLSGVYTLLGVVYCIRGYVGVPVSASVVSAATDTVYDPPPLTPAWGLKNTLWFIYCSGGTPNGETYIGFPANYGNTYNLLPTPTKDIHQNLYTARRKLRAATEDPGLITASGPATARARTIAVQGIA